MHNFTIENLLTALEAEGIAPYVSFNVSLAPKTTFRIGGKACIFFAPPTPEILLRGLNAFSKLGLPISVLGGGSNLLVSDKGVDGVVVSLEKLASIEQILANTHRPTIEKPQAFVYLASETSDINDKIKVQAGALTDEVSRFCVKKGLKGFEDFAGLPGSIGGALFMNARCYDSEISKRLVAVNLLRYTESGFVEETYAYKDSDWAYKVSPFQAGFSGIEIQQGASVILSAEFAVEKAETLELQKRYDTIYNDRKTKGHFEKPSCGSTFKNNRKFGSPTGAIIEELNLKGTTIGGAQIAPFHGNFIINLGNATAKDVRALIELIQTRVKSEKGFDLEPEVIFAGNW